MSSADVTTRRASRGPFHAATVAAAAVVITYLWLDLVSSLSLGPRSLRLLPMIAGMFAIFFVAGTLLGRLTSSSRSEQLGLGCAFALGSVLQAAVLSVQWGAQGPWLVFIAMAIAVVIAWSLGGAALLFFGGEDTFAASVLAGASSALLLLTGRTIAPAFEPSTASMLMTNIALAMFVVPAIAIGMKLERTSQSRPI